MNPYQLADGEYRLVALIWENEPLTSTQLVRLCESGLGWKKATTYTVLRKLCERGVLQNRDTIVTSLVTKAEVQKFESSTLLQKSFGNSLPAFIASFLQDRKLSREEADEIRSMIEAATQKEEG